MKSTQHVWLTEVSNEKPLFFILGPCVLEHEASALFHAEKLKELSEKLRFNLIFKTSFDKANRTSVHGFRGVGFDQGLKILERIKNDFALPVVTDIHESWQAEPAAAVVDVLQIPAMLCRQTDLLIAAGATGKPVNIKKGQFYAPENMKQAADKVLSTGNQHVWLCERGYTFGYNTLIVDPLSFPIMKKTGLPVVFDATHAVQKPNALGHSSGGDRSLVPHLLNAAVSQAIAGVFMEVHENPDQALSDGPNSVRLSQLESLLSYTIQLDQWIKSHDRPEIF